MLLEEFEIVLLLCLRDESKLFSIDLSHSLLNRFESFDWFDHILFYHGVNY